MSKSELISVRVSPEVAETLEKIARNEDRSKSYVAARALQSYTEDYAREAALIEEGLRDIGQGRVVEDQEIEAMITSWEKDEDAHDEALR